ncbi:MAG TPA: NADH-quinone oxidoreductase subunit NuoE [Terriglobia bacterium]|nr:NADH-quinone oxidoreductase subunit NuoE [Terriglobia bacterium]
MLPENLLNKFGSLVNKYPVKRSALVPILLITQEELGYLTAESIRFIADYLGIPEIEVQEVITFYSMLRTTPVGKHHIQVCTNISCMLTGGEEIFRRFSEKLGIKEGETTHDRQYSLTEVECLGACANAPAIQINYQYHEDLTLEKVDRILEDLEKGFKTDKK